MLVAHVERTVREIVLIDPRRTQQHLAQGHVLAAGHVLDGVARETIGGGANLRLDADLGGAEALGDHGDFLGRLLRLGEKRHVDAGAGVALDGHVCAAGTDAGLLGDDRVAPGRHVLETVASVGRRCRPCHLFAIRFEAQRDAGGSMLLRVARDSFDGPGRRRGLGRDGKEDEKRGGGSAAAR